MGVKEEIRAKEEKVLQEMIPSEPKVEEVVESCDKLNQHLITSETKKRRAKKAKNSSFSGIQETTVPMESAKPQEQTVDLEEKPFQDIVPFESQTKEFVEPFGTLSQKIASSEKNLKKANKSRDKSIPREQETVLPMDSI